jgi:hypothetical protein
MATIARNIGPGGRRRRLIGGLVLLVLGAGSTALLILGGFNRGSRLALFLPFFASALGLLQARDHTCVMLAAAGQCELDRGIEPLSDQWLAGQLKRQAREVLVESALGAALVTGLILMIPA